MSDLISRDDAIRALNGSCSNWEDDAKVQEIIMAIPSAEAVSREEYERLEALYDAIRVYDSSAEAVQGEWIDIDYYYRMATCSHCRKVTMFEKWGECTKPYNFCPNCGARMKGGDKNEID